MKDRKIKQDLLINALSFTMLFGSVCRRLYIGHAMVVVLVLLFPTIGLSSAVQDDKGDVGQPLSEMDQEIQNQLDELGMTIKAASISGVMTDKEAIRLYMIMSERLKSQMTGSRIENTSKGSGSNDSGSDVKRISVPRPEQISVLYQTEFRKRDISILRDELDLDSDQIMITEALLEGYQEAFNLASTPLRESIRTYKRVRTDHWMNSVLERVKLDDNDLGLAVANTQAFVEKYERAIDEKNAASGATAAEVNAKRATRDDWGQRAIEATAMLQDRLTMLRVNVDAERLILDKNKGANITANDIVRMAQELRYERLQLRTVMTESLQAILYDKQVGSNNVRFETAMALVQINRLLPQGNLSGESMNLWTALQDTVRNPELSVDNKSDMMDDVEILLNESAVSIANTLDQRTEIILDREIEGLDFQVARDRIAIMDGGSDFDVDNSRLANAIKPYASDTSREVVASVTVRDELLTLLDQSSAHLNEKYPDTNVTDIYREVALKRAFRNEMRKRWSEQAISTALKSDKIDDNTREALTNIKAEIDTELQIIRADAIAKRIQRDPRYALEQIDLQYSNGEKSKTDYGMELWWGINYEAFDSLDKRTEQRLNEILSAEVMETLPIRKRPMEKGFNGGGGSKGKGN